MWSWPFVTTFFILEVKSIVQHGLQPLQPPVASTHSTNSNIILYDYQCQYTNVCPVKSNKWVPCGVLLTYTQHHLFRVPSVISCNVILLPYSYIINDWSRHTWQWQGYSQMTVRRVLKFPCFVLITNHYKSMCLCEPVIYHIGWSSDIPSILEILAYHVQYWFTCAYASASQAIYNVK